MSNVKVQNDRYTVEPLYQWDTNRKLTIYGLSLPSTPEIHFTNESMSRAIVQRATMDSAGVITVDIPNSLLQKPYKIKAYVCIDEGATFKSLYCIEIPVKARTKPGDYTLENDNEVYSFNALEKKVDNAVQELETATDLVNQARESYKLAEAIALKCDTTLDEIQSLYDDSKTALETCENKLSEIADWSNQLNEMDAKVEELETEQDSKANAPTISSFTLLASGWVDSQYSFETTYPSADYDIEIAVDSSATLEQVRAFNSAMITGNVATNIVKCYGSVPTVDIPIILKVVAK